MKLIDTNSQANNGVQNLLNGKDKLGKLQTMLSAITEMTEHGSHSTQAAFIAQISCDVNEIAELFSSFDLSKEYNA
jgi:hypothetical protein